MSPTNRLQEPRAPEHSGGPPGPALVSSVLGSLQLPGALGVPLHAVVRQPRLDEGVEDGEVPPKEEYEDQS